MDRKEKVQTLETWSKADSGFVTSEAFYRDEEVNKLAKDFKTPKRNEVNQAVGVSVVKKYKSLFTGKFIFEEVSSQRYTNHLDSSLEIKVKTSIRYIRKPGTKLYRECVDKAT